MVNDGWSIAEEAYLRTTAALAAEMAGDVSSSAALPLFDIVRTDTVEPKRVKYAWGGRIPLGALTLMPGEEGIGKSTIGANLISATTRGALPGEFYGTPRNVFVLAIEDGLDDVWVPRLQAAGADMSRVFVVRARMTEGGEPALAVTVPDDLAALAEEMAPHDPALVWIDALVTTLPDDVNSISYKDIAKTIWTLGQWAAKHDLAVVAPWHLNKATGTDTAIRMMDSRAFRTASRSVLLVVPDPEAPPNTTRGIIALDKTNASAMDVPALRYEVVAAPYSVSETSPEGWVSVVRSTTGVVNWLGKVEGDGRAIARAALSPQIAVENDAVQWLRAFLAGGEQPRMDVVAAAEEDGYSEPAMKRAARTLGVVSRHEGGQDEQGNPRRFAVWSLQSGQSGQSDQSDPTEDDAGPLDSSRITTDRTDPTDPTGADLRKRNGVSVQSGQSTQSAQGDPTWAPDAPSHCNRCGEGLMLRKPGRTLCGACERRGES